MNISDYVILKYVFEPEINEMLDWKSHKLVVFLILL